MKKIITLSFSIAAICIITSCSKDSYVKPAVKAQKAVVADRTDVGTGDLVAASDSTGRTNQFKPVDGDRFAVI